MKSNLLINNLIKTENKNQTIVKNVSLVIFGTIFMSLMAQLKIVLPFTPVPITGGTFAVMLIGLLYGKKLAPATLLSYIVAGTIGLPVFAGFKSGLILFSPTGGYVIGYFLAALMCGYFADKGYTKSYIKTIIILLLASVVIYFFGLIQLSFFVGNKNVFMVGLVPFIPGDLIKITFVTLLLPSIWKISKNV
ncbi:MAG: biotin transporter BioY [Leptotrichiaceae bacterium]|nr:biotin transporter BioY [Leptotrichiaceae bacterium]MBP6280680.1 biotin transporter BioY [Leptotrichiaceae bacterium]MBP7725428.1 biotin transporter BioY [Leptotrichiaceae bacterium]MBP9628921.1 biotin transporter BioY [Leptotrichiaceae bacterium]